MKFNTAAWTAALVMACSGFLRLSRRRPNRPAAEDHPDHLHSGVHQRDHAVQAHRPAARSDLAGIHLAHALSHRLRSQTRRRGAERHRRSTTFPTPRSSIRPPDAPPPSTCTCICNVTLTERATGKVLFTRPSSKRATATKSAWNREPVFRRKRRRARPRQPPAWPQQVVTDDPVEFLMTPEPVPRSIAETARRPPIYSWARSLPSRALPPRADRRRASDRGSRDRIHPPRSGSDPLAAALDDARSLSLFASRTA